MTGTRLAAVTARISPSPPRGMHRSTYSVRASNSVTASRSDVVTSWIASEGKRSPNAVLPAPASKPAISRFEFMASLPPRRIVAFPVLKHSDAASDVTLGRDS